MKLTENSVQVIRICLANRPKTVRKMVYYKMLGDTFGVSVATVNAIKEGFTWRSVKSLVQ